MTSHSPSAYLPAAYNLPQSVAASIPAGDQFFASVVLLMHFDGAYDSTTFTSTATPSRTFTPAGNAKQRHGSRLFGVGAGYFDGVDDELATDISTDFSFGSGDFCIEFAFCIQSFLNTTPHFISITDGSFNNEIRLYTTPGGTKLNAVIYHGAAYQVNIAGTTNLVVDKWYRGAFCRSGNVHRLFLDGALEGSATVSHTIPAASHRCRIAALSGAGNPYRHQGQIDEVRITKGVARYTAAYTPDSVPFPDSL